MKVKTAIISFVTAGALATGAVYGAYSFSSSRKPPVKVAPAAAVKYDYWDYGEMSSNSGEIVTRDTQRVQKDSELRLKGVYVRQGDAVSVGDKILEYDSELLELKKEMSEIELQQLKIQLSMQEKSLRKLGVDPDSIKAAEPIDVSKIAESEGDSEAISITDENEERNGEASVETEDSAKTKSAEFDELDDEDVLVERDAFEFPENARVLYETLPTEGGSENGFEIDETPEGEEIVEVPVENPNPNEPSPENPEPQGGDEEGLVVDEPQTESQKVVLARSFLEVVSAVKARFDSEENPPSAEEKKELIRNALEAFEPISETTKEEESKDVFGRDRIPTYRFVNYEVSELGGTELIDAVGKAYAYVLSKNLKLKFKAAKPDGISSFEDADMATPGLDEEAIVEAEDAYYDYMTFAWTATASGVSEETAKEMEEGFEKTAGDDSELFRELTYAEIALITEPSEIIEPYGNDPNGENQEPETPKPEPETPEPETPEPELETPEPETPEPIYVETEPQTTAPETQSTETEAPTEPQSEPASEKQTERTIPDESEIEIQTDEESESETIEENSESESEGEIQAEPRFVLTDSLGTFSVEASRTDGSEFDDADSLELIDASTFATFGRSSDAVTNEAKAKAGLTIDGGFSATEDEESDSNDLPNETLGDGGSSGNDLDSGDYAGTDFSSDDAGSSSSEASGTEASNWEPITEFFLFGAHVENADGVRETENLTFKFEISDMDVVLDAASEGTTMSVFKFDENGELTQSGVLDSAPVLSDGKIEWTTTDATTYMFGIGTSHAKIESSKLKNDDSKNGTGDYGDYGDYDDSSDFDSEAMTPEERQEAIDDGIEEIRELRLRIRETEMEIEEYQRKLDRCLVTASVNGVVEKIGDDGGDFVVISGGKGLYLEGTISETDLSGVKIGSIVSGVCYETGQNFTAEIVEISPYPTEAGMNSYGFGMSESNGSRYPFYAFVNEQDAVREGYVDYVMPKEKPAETLYLENFFIRADKTGRNYVLVDDGNGKLEKRQVVTGASVDGAATEIIAGLRPDDLIAFPYGKNVKVGAKTETVETLELY